MKKNIQIASWYLHDAQERMKKIADTIGFLSAWSLSRFEVLHHRWRKAGSGKSLQLLKQKKVDIIMVHAPATEKQAGVEPFGDWYVLTKTFMMATLKMANETNGYFMTDSSTWVAAEGPLSCN